MGAIKGLRVVLGIILCLVLGASVWLTVQEQVLHQEETAVAGILLRPVEESSREPTLAWGDLAVKEECYIEIVSYGGDTTGYQIPFNVHYTGVKTAGTFDPATKTFTETD